jgi:hypothetical protein
LEFARLLLVIGMMRRPELKQLDPFLLLDYFEGMEFEVRCLWDQELGVFEFRIDCGVVVHCSTVELFLQFTTCWEF